MSESFQITLFEPPLAVDDVLYRGMVALHERLFPSGFGWMEENFPYRKDLMIAVAHDGAMNVVGYKLGYMYEPVIYFSCTGGVDEDSRGRGIGRALMRAQHAWCVERGYRAVRTETKNEYRMMLILNISEGFDVIGTFTNHRGQAQIILQKIF